MRFACVPPRIAHISVSEIWCARQAVSISRSSRHRHRHSRAMMLRFFYLWCGGSIFGGMRLRGNTPRLTHFPFHSCKRPPMLLLSWAFHAAACDAAQRAGDARVLCAHYRTSWSPISQNTTASPHNRQHSCDRVYCETRSLYYGSSIARSVRALLRTAIVICEYFKINMSSRARLQEHFCCVLTHVTLSRLVICAARLICALFCRHICLLHSLEIRTRISVYFPFRSVGFDISYECILLVTCDKFMHSQVLKSVNATHNDYLKKKQYSAWGIIN